jgi:hypothetical protein
VHAVYADFAILAVYAENAIYAEMSCSNNLINDIMVAGLYSSM